MFGSPATCVASPASEPPMGLFSLPVPESSLAATGSGVTLSETVAVEVAPDLSVTT